MTSLSQDDTIPLRILKALEQSAASSYTVREAPVPSISSSREAWRKGGREGERGQGRRRMEGEGEGEGRGGEGKKEGGRWRREGEGEGRGGEGRKVEEGRREEGRGGKGEEGEERGRKVRKEGRREGGRKQGEGRGGVEGRRREGGGKGEEGREGEREEGEEKGGMRGNKGEGEEVGGKGRRGRDDRGGSKEGGEGLVEVSEAPEEWHTCGAQSKDMLLPEAPSWSLIRCDWSMVLTARPSNESWTQQVGYAPGLLISTLRPSSASVMRRWSSSSRPVCVWEGGGAQVTLHNNH